MNGDELQKALLQREVKRRYAILERVVNGLERGHVFVEFEDAAAVEVAMGGPGRRVDVGQPDEQGFSTPAVWVVVDEGVEPQPASDTIETGTGG